MKKTPTETHDRAPDDMQPEYDFDYSKARPNRFADQMDGTRWPIGQAVLPDRSRRMVNYRDYITVEPGKRSGKPCIRGLRITVYDILNMLADGMAFEEIMEDFPKITREDILACLAYAAERENRVARSGV